MHLVTEDRLEQRAGPVVDGLAGWVLGFVRLLNAGASRKRVRKQLRVVETLQIGPKKQLVLVSCGGERFLVGTGPESVGTITRVRREGESAVGAGAVKGGKVWV